MITWWVPSHLVLRKSGKSSSDGAFLGHTQPMCFARRCYCYYLGTKYFFNSKVAFANIFIAKIEKV